MIFYLAFSAQYATFMKALRTLALLTAILSIKAMVMGQTSTSGADMQTGQRVIVRSGVIGQTSRFEVGLQAGPSLSWLRGNKFIDDSGTLLGPAAGLTLQYNFSSHLGLRLGAGYQQKGSSIDVTFTDINVTPLGTGTVRSELQYLNIPLMLRFGFGEKFRVSAGAGAYAGLLISARYVPTGFDFPDQTVTDNYENLDMGVCASLSGALALGEHMSLSAEARYDKGLTNISALPVVDDGSIRTNAVCLLVGCSYRFGSAL